MPGMPRIARVPGFFCAAQVPVASSPGNSFSRPRDGIMIGQSSRGPISTQFNGQAEMEFYYQEIEKDLLIITADGGIDRHTSRKFMDDVLRLIDGGVHKIIIDCEKLTYISSSGLAALLRLHKRARAAGGEVKIANVHSRVADLLNITHLNRIFGIYPDVNRARLDFRPKDDQQAS
jgi:anti-sigma B factor antagonist